MTSETPGLGHRQASGDCERATHPPCASASSSIKWGDNQSWGRRSNHVQVFCFRACAQEVLYGACSYVAQEKQLSLADFKQESATHHQVCGHTEGRWRVQGTLGGT